MFLMLFLQVDLRLKMIFLRLCAWRTLCKGCWNGTFTTLHLYVGKLVAEQINKNAIDKTIEPYGKTIDEVFVLASRAKSYSVLAAKKYHPGQ